MLFLILKYYAAIAANWYVCSEERAAAQSNNCILRLDFCMMPHTHITRDADCYGQNDERGIFLFFYYKKKIPPRVLKAIWIDLSFCICYTKSAKRIVTYHIRKNATLKRRKQRKLLISNGIFDDSLRIKRPMTTTSRTSGTTGIRSKGIFSMIGAAFKTRVCEQLQLNIRNQ